MQIQIWEHFAHQANQSNFDAEKSTILLENMMIQQRIHWNEETLRILKHYKELIVKNNT